MPISNIRNLDLPMTPRTLEIQSIIDELMEEGYQLPEWHFHEYIARAALNADPFWGIGQTNRKKATMTTPIEDAVKQHAIVKKIMSKRDCYGDCDQAEIAKWIIMLDEPDFISRLDQYFGGRFTAGKEANHANT